MRYHASRFGIELLSLAVAGAEAMAQPDFSGVWGMVLGGEIRPAGIRTMCQSS